MKKLAYLECQMGADGVREQRLVSKEDFSAPTHDFKNWLDWAEPGEAFLKRGGPLYLCVQLTTGE